jgi:hypothetical protein
MNIKSENYHPKTDINNSGSKYKTKYFQKYIGKSFKNPNNLTNSFYSKTNYTFNSYKDNYIKGYVSKLVKEKFINLTGSNSVSKSINLKHIKNNKLRNHYNQIKKRSNNYNSYNPYQEININNTNSNFKTYSYMDN